MAFLYRRIAASAVLCREWPYLAVGFWVCFSTNFAMLLVARIVQAVELGVFIPLMMNTILDVTPKNKLGSYLSLGGCTITFGPAFVPRGMRVHWSVTLGWRFDILL